MGAALLEDFYGFPATCVSSHGIRAKRGLSVDEQKKLVDALNEDRKKVGLQTGLKMKQLVYNTSLESEVTGGLTCSQTRGFLRWNKIWQEFVDHANLDQQLVRLYFQPSITSIACSKTFHCSETLAKNDPDTQLAGKTIELYGLCVFPWKKYLDLPNELHSVKLPPVTKYADIIGVPMPGEKQGSETGTKDENLGSGKIPTENQGSGRVFNFIIFLLLVIHI